MRSPPARGLSGGQVLLADVNGDGKADYLYVVPGLTAGKSYTVRLHFAETRWLRVGQRISNVVISGRRVLTNFDIVAVAGAADKAVVERFTVAADSTGKMTIRSPPSRTMPRSTAIEILL